MQQTKTNFWKDQTNWQTFSYTNKKIRFKLLRLRTKYILNITIDFIEVNRIIKEYYEQLYDNKKPRWMDEFREERIRVTEIDLRRKRKSECTLKHKVIELVIENPQLT